MHQYCLVSFISFVKTLKTKCLPEIEKLLFAYPTSFQMVDRCILSSFLLPTILICEKHINFQDSNIVSNIYTGIKAEYVCPLFMLVNVSNIIANIS